MNMQMGTHVYKSLRNQGRILLRDRTVPAEMATPTLFVKRGTVFLDFHHDSWPDVFAVNGHVASGVDGAEIGESFAQPRLLFWDRGDGVFHSVSESAGTGITESSGSQGAEAGDLDNEGDVEIAVVNLDQSLAILQDQNEPAGHWLSVRAASRSGGDALGVRVAATLPYQTLTSKTRRVASYLSQSAFRLHFGLGESQSAQVEVEWPSGAAGSGREVSENQIVTFREGTEP